MGITEGTDIEVFTTNLKKAIESESEYDFIFLDAQAGTDLYAKETAKLADQCIIVSEFDPVSAQGIERLKVHFSDILDPRRTWVLFNKILPEFAQAIGEGLAVARYLPPIPWDADVVRAFANRD